MAERVLAEKRSVSALSGSLSAALAQAEPLTAQYGSERVPDSFSAARPVMAFTVPGFIQNLLFYPSCPRGLLHLLRQRPDELHEAFPAVGLHAELPPADYEDQILVVPGLGEILRAEPEAVLEAVLGDKDL